MLNSKNKVRYNIKTLCNILLVRRPSYIKFVERQTQKTLDSDLVLVEKIKEIISTTRKYGYRRITRELKKQTICVNHKKVLKLMRANNLLCKQNKKFVPTTNSNHNLPKYSNLILNTEITKLNQVWASDITYVSLGKYFVYVAVILDLCSRKVIGWSISKNIDENLTIEALNKAIENRGVFEGLIHHSDKGVQYASYAYTQILKNNNIKISMSSTANPYDNAFVERFMRTLKQEEVYMNEYEDIADAKLNIDHFIENIYNKKRLHSSLDYVSPDEFEFALNSVSNVLSFRVPN